MIVVLKFVFGLREEYGYPQIRWKMISTLRGLPNDSLSPIIEFSQVIIL